MYCKPRGRENTVSKYVFTISGLIACTRRFGSRAGPERVGLGGGGWGLGAGGVGWGRVCGALPCRRRQVSVCSCSKRSGSHRAGGGGAGGVRVGGKEG